MLFCLGLFCGAAAVVCVLALAIAWDKRRHPECAHCCEPLPERCDRPLCQRCSELASFAPVGGER